LREEDKNIFDYCRENNIDHISQAISLQKVDVNIKDEEVFTNEIHHRTVIKLYWWIMKDRQHCIMVRRPFFTL
ncbi:unnamed protein product, partial [Tetraodon nigroviridis]